jgi:2-haloacid dehalogenase
MDFARFTHLTFDCYGTLIDWETGILAALHPLAARHGVRVSDEEILRLYTRFEAEQESGTYRPYRSVLEGVTKQVADALGFSLTPEERKLLPASVGQWPPFADTVQALHRLQSRYKLVILSNIDDDLFAETQRELGVPFDAIITAQQVGSYKPAHGHFETALKRLDTPREAILHVAQSLYHDHVPAQKLGFASVWVNRPSLLAGTGLALPVQVTPDLEVPDLKALADQMGL